MLKNIVSIIIIVVLYVGNVMLLEMSKKWKDCGVDWNILYFVISAILLIFLTFNVIALLFPDENK